MELWQHGLLGLVGFISGFLNVLAGGGSLLTVPAMIFLGLPPATANGTNRIAILAQNMAAVGGFRGKGFSDFPLSLALGLCTIPGAILGAFVAVEIDPEWFERILGIVMILVLVQILRPKRKRKPSGGTGTAGARDADPPVRPGDFRRVWPAYLAMVGIGFYGGFLQAGVGFLLMAALHTVLGLDLVRVNMHKVFIVMLFTVPAIVIFAWSGTIDWAAAVVLSAGNALGGWVGSNAAVAKGEKLIRVVFAITVLAMAARLLVP